MEKKKKNLGRNNGKMGRPPPDWLFDLKNGKYTAEDIVKFAKKTKQNVRRIMKIYCSDVTYTIQNGVSVANYLWNTKKFLEKYENQQIKKVS
jgi:hypothetical protein